jgi:hypothetical protein
VSASGSQVERVVTGRDALPGRRSPIPPGGIANGPAAGTTGVVTLAAGSQTWPNAPAKPPPCICEHGRGVHDIARDNRTRTRCLHIDGPRGVPCRCAKYSPKESE